MATVVSLTANAAHVASAASAHAAGVVTAGVSAGSRQIASAAVSAMAT